MTEILTAAQMRAIEAAAIASGAVTGLELMERAGRGVVDAVFAEWPELQAGSFRAVVLCGPGNNGGDGFVVARLLKEWGWEVEVSLHGSPERMPADARVNYERWVGMGEVGTSTDFDPWGADRDVVIDAIFGTGLTRAPEGEVASFIERTSTAASLTRGKSVAVDLPSGLCSDSGRELGSAAQVDLTVTFSWMKRGHVLAAGPSCCGRITCHDIGLPRNSPAKVLGRAYNKTQGIKADFSAIVRLVNDHTLLPGFSSPQSILDKAFSGTDAHKFSHGHALILSGPPGHGGAARMSSRGALRIGAGLVTLACPPEALAENAGRLDAIMLKTVADGAGLAEILADTRINALCLGPGLGLDARAAELVRVALEQTRAIARPTDDVA
ncbi:MAG: NAD(P)H-hydrate epimerase, partial [bacterium]